MEMVLVVCGNKNGVWRKWRFLEQEQNDAFGEVKTGVLERTNSGINIYFYSCVDISGNDHFPDFANQVTARQMAAGWLSGCLQTGV